MTKEDVHQLLGCGLMAPMPERISPDQMAVLLAGTWERTPLLSAWQRQIRLHIERGELDLITESITLKREPKPIGWHVMRGSGKRVPIRWEHLNEEEKEKTVTKHWVTREAARDWLQLHDREPSPAMALWLQAENKAAVVSRREATAMRHQAWHAEVSRLESEKKMNFSAACKLIANQERYDASTVEKAVRKLARNAKDAQPAKKARYTPPLVWPPSSMK